jgi:hypothetical protein
MTESLARYARLPIEVNTLPGMSDLDRDKDLNLNLLFGGDPDRRAFNNL